MLWTKLWKTLLPVHFFCLRWSLKKGFSILEVVEKPSKSKQTKTYGERIKE